MPDGAVCLGDDDVLRLAGDVELDWKWLSEEWSRRKWLISVEGTMNQWLSVVTHQSIEMKYSTGVLILVEGRPLRCVAEHPDDGLSKASVFIGKQAWRSTQE
jgi:hypothetical protein